MGPVGSPVRTTDVESPPAERPVEFTTLGPDARCYDDYEGILFDGDTLMIYDADDLSSWIAADVAHNLADFA